MIPRSTNRRVEQDCRVGQPERSPTARTKQVLGSRRHLGPLALALLAIAVPQAAAQDKFDPAARAKAVAPLVDESTVAVLHVDTSRVSVDAVFAGAFAILPGLEHELGGPRHDRAHLEARLGQRRDHIDGLAGGADRMHLARGRNGCGRSGNARDPRRARRRGRARGKEQHDEECPHSPTVTPDATWLRPRRHRYPPDA